MRHFFFTFILWFGSLSFGLAQAKLNTNDSLKIKEFVDGLEEYYQKPKYYKDNIKSINQLVSKYLDRSDFKGNKFLNLSRARIYDFYSFFEGIALDYDSSLDLLLKAEKIKTEFKDFYTLPATYRGMAKVWRTQKNYDKEKVALQKALELAKKYDNKDEIIKSQSGLYQWELIVYETNYPEKIKEKRQEIYNNYKILAEKAISYNLYSDAGNAYFQMSRLIRLLGNVKQSFSDIELSRINYEKDKNLIGIEKAIYSLAVAYRKDGESKKAIGLLKECIDKVKVFADSNKLKTRYLSVSNTAESMNDYKLAYEYYVKYKDVTDAMTNNENLVKLLNAEANFKIQRERELDSIKLEKDRVILSYEVNYKNKVKYLGSIIFLIVLTAIFIILTMYFRYKKVNAQNKLLTSTLKINNLENLITIKREQVSSLIAENLSQIKSKENILKELDNLDIGKEGVSNIKSLINELKAERIEDDRSKVLKSNFETLNSDFIERLKLRFPDLTKAEVEMASLTNLGLNSKEIATLRNVSIDAVKKSRSRLKKKMGIDVNQKINDFLKSI